MLLAFEQLFSKQRALKQYITKTHNLGEEKLFDESMLALLVELGELANETRCFKYWSAKPRSSVRVVLEEYVDNIHFLLSIGLSKGYEFSALYPENSTLNETEQFLHVFDACLSFYKDNSEENYLTLFKSFLELAVILGFSAEDIEQAYDKKNEVNYARQLSGY